MEIVAPWWVWSELDHGIQRATTVLKAAGGSMPDALVRFCESVSEINTEYNSSEYDVKLEISGTDVDKGLREFFTWILLVIAIDVELIVHALANEGPANQDPLKMSQACRSIAAMSYMIRYIGVRYPKNTSDLVH